MFADNAVSSYSLLIDVVILDTAAFVIDPVSFIFDNAATVNLVLVSEMYASDGFILSIEYNDIFSVLIKTIMFH